MRTIRDELLKRIFLIMLGAIVIAIVGSNLFIYPSFTAMLVNDAKSDSVVIAKHLSRMLFPDTSVLPVIDVPESSHQILDKLVKEFSLSKLKIFGANGETIYSTDHKDVGVINTHDYFHNEVRSGNILIKFVKKDAETLEGQQAEVAVVETYVPIMNGERFLGALELYDDITAQEKIIYNAVLLCNILSIGFSVLFLLICLTVARKLDSNITEREEARSFLRMVNIDLKNEIESRLKAEKEKETLIMELEETLLKLNTLKGLVPICSFCKNIRNDSGYWEQMEAFVEKHSDAEFSHGLCPDCAAKHYPDLHLDEDDEEYTKRQEKGVGEKNGDNPPEQ